MNYEDKTNKELKELCDVLELEVNAKNTSKPTKAELISALNKYDGIEEEVDQEVAEEMVEQITEDAAPKATGKQTAAQKRREQIRELTKLVRVMATNNADNQTKADLEYIGWGNDLIGYKDDRILLGKPWHIRQGALNNLKSIMISKPVQNEEQNRIDYIEIPKYNIQDLGLLSKEEYAAMAEKQKIRNAASSALQQ